MASSHGLLLFFLLMVATAYSIHGEHRFCGTPTNHITSDGVPRGCSSASAVAGGMVDFSLDRDPLFQVTKDSRNTSHSQEAKFVVM